MRNLPLPFDLSWNHISDVPLADPRFGQPGRIDILLGVDINFLLMYCFMPAKRSSGNSDYF